MACNIIYLCSIGLEEIGNLATLFAGRFIKGLVVGVYSFLIPMLSINLISKGDRTNRDIWAEKYTTPASSSEFSRLL